MTWDQSYIDEVRLKSLNKEIKQLETTLRFKKSERRSILRKQQAKRRMKR